MILTLCLPEFSGRQISKTEKIAMKKGLSIGRIILIVLGVLIIWLSARALLGVPQQQKVLGDAVYLDEAVVLPENEGKVVIIHGKPLMTAPAYDEELGITLNSIKAYRYDEEYKLTSNEKSKHRYDWVSRGQKSIVGDAMIGEFDLDEKTLIGFPADSDYDDFDDAEIFANGYNMSYGKTAEGAVTERLYVIVGGPADEAYYYSPHEYSNADSSRIMRNLNYDIAVKREGTKAYAYKVFTGAVSEEVTVAGIQQGNELVAHEALNAVVANGVMTKNQLAKTEGAYLVIGSGVFLLLGLLLVFLGLRKTKKNKKKTTQKRAER